MREVWQSWRDGRAEASLQHPVRARRHWRRALGRRPERPHERCGDQDLSASQHGRVKSTDIGCSYVKAGELSRPAAGWVSRCESSGVMERPARSGVALLAVGERELGLEAVVLLAQSLVLVAQRLEALAQRRFASALLRRNRCGPGRDRAAPRSAVAAWVGRCWANKRASPKHTPHEGQRRWTALQPFRDVGFI